MRAKKRITALIMTCTLVIMLLTGCGGNTSPSTEATAQATSTPTAVQNDVTPTPTAQITAEAETPAESEYAIETLIVGTAANLEAPSRSVYNFDVYTGTLTQMAPVCINENAEVMPLATDFTTDDYATWTLTVIDGLTWHDGIPVTAEDVKFTIEYNALQSTGAEQTTYAEINVVNERTVDLVLPAPNVRHLSSLTTMRLIPKHIFEGIEDMTTATEEQMTIGCGPYKFSAHNADAGTFTFTAYEDFVWGVPNVKTVIFRSFGSVDTLNLALKAGEVDMIYAYAGGVGAAAAADFAASANITLLPVKDTSNTAVFVFNNNLSPGNDVNIRKAVAYAVDYDKFHELFGSDYSVRSTEGFVPPGSFGYIDMPVLVRDLDKARQYLEAAGAEDSDGDGIVEYNGEPLVVELMVRSDIPVYERYAELLKSNMSEIGIELTFNITDVPTFREITEQSHTNQAMISKFTAFGMGMQAGLGTAYLDGRGTSNAQGQIMDTRFAEIVDKLKSAASPEEYLAAAADCQAYYAEEMPAIALFWDSYIQAFNTSIDNFTIDGTFGILNMKTWFTISKN